MGKEGDRMDLDQIWKSALGEIELHVSRPTFLTWFRNSKLLECREGNALVALPNHFVKEWIQNKHYKTVLGALRNLDETTKKVEFLVIQKNKPLPLSNAMIPEEFGQLSFSELKIDPETNLNPRYTLGTFIVGKSNELAHAAAETIVKEVGHKYNPFFIYGGVGLGKTHLIQGVGNEIKQRYQSTIKVKYVSSEKFMNDVIWAIRNKRMETIKEKYRLIDVLIIDDIQFIAGKAATEEEFFHTFNALHEHNKQIIITSDRPPKFIPTLEERLRSRFEGGMLVDIGFPDYELRVAIIRSKLQDRNAKLEDPVIDLVANKMQKNVREIEGLLNRMLFYQTRKGSAIIPKEADQIISEVIQEPNQNINPNHVIKAVADFSEITPAELVNRSRKKEVAEARQIAMYLLREMLGLSYPFIGKKLGKRDHTTAIYAYEKIAKDIPRNPALNQKILLIREHISKLPTE